MLAFTRYIIISLVVVFMFVLLGCDRHSSSWSSMLVAERLMDAHPDSALSILDSLDFGTLRRSDEQALYGLLSTMAREKSYMDPTDDSLINISVDYYLNKCDKKRYMKSEYYLGCVNLNKRNYTPAIISFLKANDLAEEQGEWFWAGMACRGIMDIYNFTFNKAEEVIYAEKSYEYMKRSGRQPHINYALMDLATMRYNRALHVDKDYSIPMCLIQQIVDSAQLCGDNYLKKEADALKASCLIAEDKSQSAIPILSEVCRSSYADFRDSLNLSLAYARSGEWSNAKKLLKKISKNDTLFRSYILASIYEQSGDSLKSYKTKTYVLSKNNEILIDALTNNMRTIVVEHMELNRKMAEEKIRTSRITLLMISLISLFIFCILFWFGIRLYRKKQRDIRNKVIFAEELQSRLDKSLENQESLASQLDTVLSYNSKANTIIENLLLQKNEILEDSISIINQSRDSRVARRKIADNITRLIDNLSVDSEQSVGLARQVDEMYDNLFTDFKHDLPNLKDADYRLYLFSVLRFSNNAIALLLKEDKIEAVYNRKRHLKDKIKRLEADKRDRYLFYIM